MSFTKYDEDGKPIRNRVKSDYTNARILVEQNHKDEVNINKIIQRHGMDLIAKTAALSTPEYILDDDPTNDFQEVMLKVTKAQQTFEQLPSDIRKEFNNSAAQYMDYIHNPENKDKLIERGWAVAPPPPPEPVEVVVTNQETPPATAES